MGKNPDVIEASHMVLLSNESWHGDLRLSGGSDNVRILARFGFPSLM